MSALEMQGNIVIESSIDTSGAQSIGDSPEAEHPVGSGDAKTEESESCKGDTENRYETCAQTSCKSVTEEAGYHCTEGDDHEDGTRPCEWNTELSVSNGPDGT
jgi:hypothetical protein